MTDNSFNQDEIKYLKDFNKWIEGLLLRIKNENDNDHKRILKNNIADYIKKGNDENDDLLKKVFNLFFDTNGYGWEELLNPTFFDTTMEDYVNKSNEFLKDK
tara:strand:+ start:20933 stop:21238 length:306 start_codon:yes stop_codon:yes gene_type:complete